MKKFFLCLICLLFLLSGCKGSDKGKLVVGMELAYPPFETTDEKGNPTGISVDLAYDLGKYLGREVKIENMSYPGLIPSLQTKKIDLIISSMTITDKRKESINFSDPYAKIGLALLINKDTNGNSVDELNKKGIKIAVKKGTTGHDFAVNNLPNAEIMVFDKESACVLEVVQGKADAFIYDQMTIYKNWKQYEKETKVNLNPLQGESWGIGIRKDDTDLLDKVNAFLKDYKKNGGFEKLADKYLKEQKDIFRELNIPFFFD